MKGLIRTLSEMVTSIPTHHINKSTNKVYEFVKKLYPHANEYVVKDFLNDKNFSKYDKDELFRAILGFPKFVTENYKLKVLNVNPVDFAESTISGFISRDFGNVNSYMVPDDYNRTKIQRSISRSDGKNEPIVVSQLKNGKYELLEGWHRTMAILLLGDNGEDMKNWDKVKIRAFVSIK